MCWALWRDCTSAACQGLRDHMFQRCPLWKRELRFENSGLFLQKVMESRLGQRPAGLSLPFVSQAPGHSELPGLSDPAGDCQSHGGSSQAALGGHGGTSTLSSLGPGWVNIDFLHLWRFKDEGFANRVIDWSQNSVGWAKSELSPQISGLQVRASVFHLRLSESRQRLGLCWRCFVNHVWIISWGCCLP